MKEIRENGGLVPLAAFERSHCPANNILKIPSANRYSMC